MVIEYLVYKYVYRRKQEQTSLINVLNNVYMSIYIFQKHWVSYGHIYGCPSKTRRSSYIPICRLLPFGICISPFVFTIKITLYFIPSWPRPPPSNIHTPPCITSSTCFSRRLPLNNAFVSFCTRTHVYTYTYYLTHKYTHARNKSIFTLLPDAVE